MNHHLGCGLVTNIISHDTPQHNAVINPLTPELNPSAQRCLMRFFTGNFAS
jgi:hypothetical protein